MGITAKSIRDGVWRVADAVGANVVAERLYRQHGWHIIMCHGICRSHLEMIEYSTRHVPVAIFRAQMEHLLSRKYEFVSLAEGVRRFLSGVPMEKCITLTFDDGFRNVVEVAYPVMVELGLKGSFYLITDYVNTDRYLWTDQIDVVCWHGKGGKDLRLEFPDGPHTFSLRDKAATFRSVLAIKRRFRSISDLERVRYFEQVETLFNKIPRSFVPQDFRFATNKEIRSLAPEVMELGNHTVSHPNLAKVDDPQKLKNEIFQSKAILEREFERPIEHFCYPGGDYNPGVVDLVMKAGHTSATTIKMGTNTRKISTLELLRFDLPASVEFFKARMSHLEGALRDLGRRVTGKPRLAS